MGLSHPQQLYSHCAIPVSCGKAAACEQVHWAALCQGNVFGLHAAVCQLLLGQKPPVYICYVLGHSPLVFLGVKSGKSK